SSKYLRERGCTSPAGWLPALLAIIRPCPTWLVIASDRILRQRLWMQIYRIFMFIPYGQSYSATRLIRFAGSQYRQTVGQIVRMTVSGSMQDLQRPIRQVRMNIVIYPLTPPFIH